MILAVLPVVRKMIDKKSKEEKFLDSNVPEGLKGLIEALWNIVNILVGAYALYLSFQRNQGFDLGSFLAACCCSWCYVAYALAVPVVPNTRNNQYRY
tara:strand:+ start:591 stop:881 length:291 start_codon:yes stop_codon:yes gene_type:complete